MKQQYIRNQHLHIYLSLGRRFTGKQNSNVEGEERKRTGGRQYVMERDVNDFEKEIVSHILLYIMNSDASERQINNDVYNQPIIKDVYKKQMESYSDIQ